MPISTSYSSWLPSMWWWPSPTGSTMKVPTLKPSSAGAGPSSGSRWLPAGYVCCYTWERWSLPSVDPLRTSPCEDRSNLLGSAGWKWRPLNKHTRSLSSDWYFVTSWHSPWLAWVGLKKLNRRKKNHLLIFFNSEIWKEATSLSPENWNFHPSGSWVIYFVCVLPLKTGIVVRQVFSFCMFLPKQSLGHDILSQGEKLTLCGLLFLSLK